MFTIILFVLSTVVLSSSQLNVGPQTVPEQTSQSPQIPDEQYINNQGFKYKIGPIRLYNAQNIKPGYQQLDQKHFEKQALMPLIKFLPREEFQIQNREQVQVQPQTFNRNAKTIYNNLEGLRFFQFPLEQKPKIQYQFIPIIVYSNNNQININKKTNLRALSTVSEENELSKAAQMEQSTSPESNNEDDEQGQAGFRIVVEDNLKGHDKNLNTNEAEGPNYQKSPFFIHRLVMVTKHYPINIVKQVKVGVPTPILVRVPEPYEVRVPHPYHVPAKVFRHYPVPIRRAH